MNRVRLASTTFTVSVAAALLAAVTGVAVAGTSHPAGASPAATLSSNWYASAPYLMPLSNNPPNPAAVMAATGQKAFQLAFILSGGGCSAAWDGTDAVSTDTQVAGVVSSIRNAGGDVSVSVGGYGGTKLGQTCSDVASTAAAYQAVVTKYGLKAIDFDLEEPEYEDTAAIGRELGAAQTLQRNNPGIFISVTMPGTSAGTGYFGGLLIDQAKSLGFTPNNYSIMPFDGGFSNGAAQVSALESFHSLLMSHLGWDSATAYAHEGFSGMNGQSDNGEHFYQADFQTVLSYATGHGLGRFTFWSVNRDRACGASTDNGVCSNVSQNDWDFTKYTTQFAGATPPTTAPPTNPPTSPPGGSCTGAAWSAATAYTGGAVVSYGGHSWTAKWWTQGDIPGNNSQAVWTDNGTCSGAGGSTATPPASDCSAAWSAATAYTGGAVVSYGGHKWTAKWWTQGDIPGNNSQAVWTDNGTC